MVREGDPITCPRCGDQHRLEAPQDAQGRKAERLLWYRCDYGDEGVYLGALDGQPVIYEPEEAT